MKNVILLVILIAAIIVLVAQPYIGGDKPVTLNVNRDLPTIKMPVGARVFTLEVANNGRTREIGLMNRDSMPADRGMIFVFPRERVLDFWMKNTRIALDIIYAAGDGTVVSIRQMKPFDEETTSSDRPAKYAIELNKGLAGQAGVKVGDRLVIPGISDDQ